MSKFHHIQLRCTMSRQAVLLSTKKYCQVESSVGMAKLVGTQQSLVFPALVGIFIFEPFGRKCNSGENVKISPYLAEMHNEPTGCITKYQEVLIVRVFYRHGQVSRHLVEPSFSGTSRPAYSYLSLLEENTILVKMSKFHHIQLRCTMTDRLHY